MINTFARMVSAGDRIGPYRVLKALDPPRRRYLAEETIGKVQVELYTVEIDELARDAYLKSVQSSANAGYEHLVPIIDCGVTDDGCFVVTDVLKGETLQARLRREHRLPPADAMRVAKAAAAGLHSIHANGLIHCDVNPASIWLEPSGGVRLLGCGHPAGDGNSLLQRLGGPGAPGFVSPEQAAGESLTPAADLFSLGCVLYRLVTGEGPFHGSSDSELFHAVLVEQPASARSLNPQVSPALDELLTCLLAKTLADRPQSALEVENRLSQLVDPDSAPSANQEAIPAPSIYPASRRILESLPRTRNLNLEPSTPVRRLEVVSAPPIPVRRTWLADLIAGVLLALGAAGLYLWWKASNEPARQPPVINQDNGKRKAP